MIEEREELLAQVRNPLTPTQLSDVDDALQVAEELPALLAKMRAAGMDVSALEERLERQRAQLQGIRSVFGSQGLVLE